METNIKYLKVTLDFVELVTILFALITPTLFITSTTNLLVFLTVDNLQPIAYAYGLTIVCICALSSSNRKWAAGTTTKLPTKITTLTSCAIIFVALFIFYSIIRSDLPEVTPEQVTSPYISYLLSVFFCMGVGYALADVFLFFIIKE